MYGTASSTISPSVLSTSRSTPWVLGCCGPMFTSSSSVRTSNSTCSGSVRSIDIGLLHPDPVVLGRHLVVLAQRVSLPILGTENPLEVRVTRKPDPREVKHLPFVPVGPGPKVAHAGGLGQLALHVVFPSRERHLQHQPLPVHQAGEVIQQLAMGLPVDLGRLLRVRLEVVDAADQVEHVEAEIRLVAQI